MEKDESFVQEETRAVFGAVNGVLLYAKVWTILVSIILQLILQDKYDSQSIKLNAIFLIMVSVITLVVNILIAHPRKLLKSIKKISLEDIKFVFKCLGLMILFSYVYNFILVMSNVDISGGNENQMRVVSLMKEAPVSAFMSLVVLAPVVEEVTYRYFIFGGIRKYNKKLAIVISGFIFMAVHATIDFSQGIENVVRELLLLPPYFFSGIVLAYAYDKKSNLAVPITIHTLNNLISFILSMI